VYFIKEQDNQTDDTQMNNTRPNTKLTRIGFASMITPPRRCDYSVKIGNWSSDLGGGQGRLWLGNVSQCSCCSHLLLFLLCGAKRRKALRTGATHGRKTCKRRYCSEGPRQCLPVNEQDSFKQEHQCVEPNSHRNPQAAWKLNENINS